MYRRARRGSAASCRRLAHRRHECSSSRWVAARSGAQTTGGRPAPCRRSRSGCRGRAGCRSAAPRGDQARKRTPICPAAASRVARRKGSPLGSITIEPAAGEDVGLGIAAWLTVLPAPVAPEIKAWTPRSMAEGDAAEAAAAGTADRQAALPLDAHRSLGARPCSQAREGPAQRPERAAASWPPPRPRAGSLRRGLGRAPRMSAASVATRRGEAELPVEQTRAGRRAAPRGRPSSSAGGGVRAGRRRRRRAQADEDRPGRSPRGGRSRRRGRAAAPIRAALGGGGVSSLRDLLDSHALLGASPGDRRSSARREAPGGQR